MGPDYECQSIDGPDWGVCWMCNLLAVKDQGV